MKKIFTCIIFSFLFSITINKIYCQLGPVIKWQKCLGGSGDDKANDVLINADGSFIAVGYSKSNDGNVTGHHGSIDSSDAWITKLDTSGNIIWQKSIGGSNADYFNTVIATNDNGYLCIGYTNSSDGDVTGSHGGGDAWVVKLNATGTVIWSKCYGGSKYDIATDAVLATDGTYAIIGTSYSYDGDVLSGENGRNYSDAWVLKINTSGSLLWERAYYLSVSVYGPHENNSIGYNINTSPNGNLYFLAAGPRDDIFELPLQIIDSLLYHPATLFQIDNDGNNLINIGTLSTYGDNGYSMCKSASGYYFSGVDISWQYPFDCYYETSYFFRKQNNSNTISSNSFDYSVNCSDAQPDFIQFSSPHGTTSADNNTLFGVGFKRQYSGAIKTGFIMSWNNSMPANYFNRKFYNGVSLNSIKGFPGGKDLIASGYTSYNGDATSGYHGNGSTNDFWVMRLEAMNNIIGDVYLDENNNNIKDAGELPFNDGIVKTTKAGFEVGGLVHNGTYQNVTDIGTFTTSISINRPYYSATPVSKTTIFTTYKNTDTADFAVHANPGIKDYTVSAISLLTPRPGFNLQYNIVYSNNGTTPLSNKNIVFIKDPRTSFLGAVPGYTSISGDTIRWNISSLSPTVSGTISLDLQLANIPQANIGDILISNINIDSTGDFTPSDNYVLLQENISGSYDPNDKKENNAGEIYPPYITAGKFLNYTVRFQNSGNDTAFTIIVRDTLDNKLNGDSVEVFKASHSYTANIQDKKYIMVTFNNIKLVDSIHNEPLSHGFFSYRVKPKSTVIVGDTIRNTASIYFDFNPPIRTNTELTFVRPSPTTNLWTGAVSNAWENSLNWGNHIIPDENTNVIINTGLTRYPIINSNAVCKSLVAKTGVNVLVKTGFTLRVAH